jgi:hypothetical protein
LHQSLELQYIIDALKISPPCQCDFSRTFQFLTVPVAALRINGREEKNRFESFALNGIIE